MKIPERFAKICAIGGHEIDVRQPSTLQYTEGWVLLRDAGGGHSVMLPKRHDKWACRYCVDRIAKGYAKQDSLL